MKRTSLFALPALLRPALLAAASQHSFSVNDDLLAYPQYEVRFSEDWISETVAQSRLDSNDQTPDDDAPQLDVEHYRPADQQSTEDGSKKKEDKFSYERLRLEGQPYLCSIPQISPSSPDQNANDTVSKQEQEKELARANDRGWELLSAMQGQCVYFISGWWSYKFCYNDGVRQFHQLSPRPGLPVYPPVEDSTVEGYTLGSYQKDKAEKGGKESAGKEVQVGKKAPKGELVQRGETRFLVQKLEGGTTCDLTNKPRRIEVQVRCPDRALSKRELTPCQFHCNPSSADRISLIKETSTCAYLMVIQTPRLCNDVAFLPPQKDEPNAITCSPILASDQDIQDYERDIALLKQAEKEAEIWAADPSAADIFLGAEEVDFPIAGDIAIGARAIVPEGVTLEKSAIVGGGKEKYIDTIASSDGRLLNREELDKLGLGDAKSLERLKRQLEKMAQGQEWKLDVVETPQGREYRGVIGKDEKEEAEDAAAAKGEGEGQGEGEDEREEGSEEEFYKEEL